MGVTHETLRTSELTVVVGRNAAGRADIEQLYRAWRRELDSAEAEGRQR